MNRIKEGRSLAITLLLIGIVLRLSAHQLAWPTNYSFSGSALETSWGRCELALCEIARIFMGLGTFMLAACFTRWLFAPAEAYGDTQKLT